MVTDNLTGLVWPRHANLKGGPSAWTAALSYANALNLCGSFDWRLPNRKELHSLSDYSQSAAALPSGHPFSGVKAHGGYWSSTTWSIMNSQAWLVGIGEGDIGACPKTDVFYVWPVRTGCFATFGEKFGLEIACLEAGARKWAFTFIYTGVGLRWKITPASIKEVPGKEAACLGLEEDFSMQIPCADFEGTRFSFIFRHTGDGLVWEIDPASIHLVD